MVNNASGEVDIASMWKDHYETLLNTVKNTSNKSDVLSAIENLVYDNDMEISVNTTQGVISKLKRASLLVLMV